MLLTYLQHFFFFFHQTELYNQACKTLKRLQKSECVFCWSTEGQEIILPYSLIGLTVDKVTGGRKINSNLIGKVHLKETNVNIVDRPSLYLFMSLVDKHKLINVLNRI